MDARRTLIADAAITVIAERGMKGLTHLAVDACAELPKGSTSYYCRKRIDLVRLALQRVHDLDYADVRAAADRFAAGNRTHRGVNRVVSTVIVAWLTGAARDRTIARFELYLAASHEPELQAAVAERVSAIVALVVGAGEAADPPAPRDRAVAVVMLAEGLLLSVVRQRLPTPGLADVERLMASLEVPPPAG